MGQPVTTNPLTIMLINMTIVFAVLWGLSLVIRLIQYIDPTKKKEVAEKPAIILPASTPVAAAVAAESAQEDDLEVAAVIAAALASFGYQASQIIAVRPVVGQAWAGAARVDAVSVRNQMV